MSLNEEALTRACMLLQTGDWQAAHEIVQQDEESSLACWAHGIVHMIEGDSPNARYWYRRAGRAFPATEAVDAEIAALRAALPQAKR